jgi:hypothetical protein
MKMSFLRVIVFVVLLLVGSDATLAYKGIHSQGHGSQKINYDSLYQAATPLSESHDGTRLVTECVAAYGGREHLEKLKTLTLHYRMVQSLSGDTADLWKYFAPGLRLKKSHRSAGNIRELILDNSRAWRVNQDTATVLTGSRYYGQLYSYQILRMPLPLVETDSGDLRYGTREGDSLRYIYWKMHDSLLIIVGINPVNKLLTSCEGVISNEGGTEVYTSRFAHHREIEGYILPGLVVDVSMGLELGTSRLESAEINPSLPDKLFRPDPVVQRSH